MIKHVDITVEQLYNLDTRWLKVTGREWDYEVCFGKQKWLSTRNPKNSRYVINDKLYVT